MSHDFLVQMAYLSNLEIPAKSSRANLGVRGYTVNKFKKLRLNNFSNNRNEQAKRKDKMRRKEKREKGKWIGDNQSFEFAAGRFSIQAYRACSSLTKVSGEFSFHNFCTSSRENVTLDH